MTIPKFKGKAKYTLFITLFTLAIFEILLRAFHHNISYSELTGHGYVTYYNQTRDTWFHVWPPNSDFEVDMNDYRYHYKTDSLGLREREFSFNRPDAAHIICIGDSYTEGMGTSYDSSFPRFLERHLNEAGVAAQVLNAGSSGSDPFYEYMLYKQKLIPARADYLFTCINATDITDYIFCGGFSRFKPNGTVVFNKGPWFEGLYAKSYLVRFWVNDICGYSNDNLFIKNDKMNDVMHEAMMQLEVAVDSFQQTTIQNNCNLLVILQPDITEVALLDAEKKRTSDLFKVMEANLTSKNINVINLWPSLQQKFNKDNYHEYTYINDSHYNGQGYNVFSEAIIAEINKKYPDFWKRNKMQD